MAFIIDGDIKGKVFGIIDSKKTNSQEELDIVNAVAEFGHYVQGEHHYYDATRFVQDECVVQDCQDNPRSVDLSKFTGWHSDVDLPAEMFTESQWIKED